MVSYKNISAGTIWYRYNGKTKKQMKPLVKQLNLTSAQSRKLNEEQFLKKLDEVYGRQQENDRIRTKPNNTKTFLVKARSVIDAKNQVIDDVVDFAKRVYDQHKLIKVGGILRALVYSPTLTDVFDLDSDEDQPEMEIDFHTTLRIANDEDHLKVLLDLMFDQLDSQLDTFLHNGSGWILDSTVHFQLDAWKQRRYRNGAFQKLQPHIAIRQAIVNPCNTDDECFRWCLRYHQTDQSKNAHRISVLEKVADRFDYTDVAFPATDEDIRKFAIRNNIDVIIFHEVDGQICRRLVARGSTNATDCIRLWYIPDPKDPDAIGHLAYIKNMSRLLNPQTGKRAKRFCNQCLQMVTPSHSEANCKTLQEEGAVIRLTKKNGSPLDKVKFTNQHKQAVDPFIATIDFEASLHPYDQSEFDGNNKKDRTKLRQKHVANSVAFTLRTSIFDDTERLKKHGWSQSKIDHERSKLEVDLHYYRGENPALHLLDELLKQQDRIQKLMRRNMLIQMTKEDEMEYEKATHCYICEGKLNPRKIDYRKVADHCHFTGHYRGACHGKCNLAIRNQKVNGDQPTYVLPIICHNLKSYDVHFLIRACRSKGFKRIEVIANSAEKYMSLRIGNLKFLDSCQFMSAPLSELVDNLKKSDVRLEQKFKATIPYIDSVFDKSDTTLTKDEFRDMLLRKGEYPYTYPQDNDVWSSTKIPSLDDFFDFLKNAHISSERYAHVERVWKETNCQIFEDYHRLYLALDVLLLHDVFDNFRKTLLSYYKLDCCKYLSLPAFSWDAMLKVTGVELELLNDFKMLTFCDRGKRGGLCFVNHRHAKSNDPRCPDYDSSKPRSQIVYLDMNQLYPSAMIEALPTGGFQWETGDLDKLLIEILRTKDDHHRGFMLEVDLHFTKEVHDKLRDFPPCPEELEITFDKMSPYNQEIIRKEGRSKKYKATKLVAHLADHHNYVVDYRLLKKAVELGAQVTKVHQVLSYQQSPWLKAYIDKNTSYRVKASNDFEKNVFKLLNNSVYGKTCEDIRNRRDLKITHDMSKVDKWSNEINFKRGWDDGELYFMEMCKKEIEYNKPSYIGSCILDLSKKLMLDFHYDWMQSVYGSDAKLLYSDTDSLIYHVHTEDVFAEISNPWSRALPFHDDRFDVSNMDGIYHSNDNKKLLRMMKIETGSIPISEGYYLRPKAYHNVIQNEGKSTVKGIQRHVVETDIRDTDFKNVLETGNPLFKNTRGFVSKKHEIWTYELKKKALSAMYDKMWVHEDGVTCTPYGHYSIAKCQ